MSELTEDQKLVKLGLRSPNQTVSAGSEIIRELQNNIAEEWDTFQENFEDANLGSWSDFETWLTDNGVISSTASNIRTRFENKYDSFSDFKSTVLNEYEFWSDFENDFASNTGLRSDRKDEDGLAAGGIKVYEEAGVGRSGQSIPAGGVEIFGKEIHFSQTSAVQDTQDEGSGSDDPWSFSNLTLSDTVLNTGDSLTVSADVTNNISYSTGRVVELIIDGTVEDSKSVLFDANQTKTVSFTFAAGGAGIGDHDVSIGPLPSKTYTVTYGGL